MSLQNHARLLPAQWHLSALRAQHRSLHSDHKGEDGAPAASSVAPGEEGRAAETPAAIPGSAWDTLKEACESRLRSDDI